MLNAVKTTLLFLIGIVLVACGPFWEVAKNPDLEGPSWDVRLELPIVGRTDQSRIIPIELLGFTMFEGPVSLLQELMEEVGPIEFELPTEAQDFMGKWILRAEIFAEMEYRLSFGADVTILFSKDRDSLFSDPGHVQSIILPLCEPEESVITTISLDFDLSDLELLEILSGEMFIGASVTLIVPEGETRMYMDTSHYIWPKIWASVDVRISPELK